MEAEATSSEPEFGRRGPPKKRPPHPMDIDFRRGVQWSALLHVGLIVFVLIKSLVFPSKPEPFIPTLRVDLVALPDMLKKDKPQSGQAPVSDKLAEALKKAEEEVRKLKPVEKTVKKAEEPTAKDEMVLKPKEGGTDKGRKKKMQSALDRIKSLAKIQSDNEAPAAPLIKGNKISKGTSTSEDARESDEPNYLDSVRDRLRDNWALPVWLARQNLSAQVRIFIDSRGMIRTYQFVKASGNLQFDEAIRTTLTDSQPLPAPPEKLAGTLLSDGVVLGFPL